MRTLTKFFVVLLCVAVPHQVFAWQGKVIAVVDGDLIVASHDGRDEKLRLFGIDTPDDPQEFGKEAREFTTKAVLGKIVEVTPVTQDRYGNTIAVVSDGGVILNRELTASGLAWVYTGSCTLPECREWRAAESEARQKGTGLWSAANPTPPWEFRRSGGNPSTGYPSTSAGSRKVEDALPYQGDIITHLYHAPGCPQYKCKSCIVEFKSRQDARKAGYKPCPACEGLSPD